MKSISYTVSPVLQQTLRTIDEKQTQIILTPLLPKQEHRLKWEAAIDRIYYSLHLAHHPVTKKEIISTLSNSKKNNQLPSELAILTYKRTMDYIWQEWLMNTKNLSAQSIQVMYKMATGQKMSATDSQLTELLNFLQASNESPLIQAYISFLQFSSLGTITETSGRFARSLPYVFLYRPGYHMRGLLVMEEYFYTNEKLIRDLTEMIDKGQNITPWLEHFTNAMLESVTNIEMKIREGAGGMSVQFWQLTERQKDILSHFDQPGLRITNRKVQTTFGISQITASRDLAKLATLGFLFPYGKGRSVYYMKV